MVATTKQVKDKQNNGDITERLRISGMDCGDCAVSIEKSLQTMPGVSAAKVNFGSGSADVSYNPAVAERDAIAQRISDLGYRLEAGAPSGKVSPTLEFSIEGMDCGDCALTVQKVVSGLPGVGSATVNFGTARLSIVPADTLAMPSTKAIEQIVSAAGYRATPVQLRNRGASQPYWRRERRVLTTVAGAAAALLAFLLSLAGAPLLLVNAVYGIATLVAGFGFARAGLLALRAGRADMNLLMSVAAVGAIFIGDWSEAATVVLLFSFGGTLQAYTLEKTRGAIRSLMSLTPATALVRRPDTGNGSSIPIMCEVRLPVEEVQVGEIVLVGPGERIPLDGSVIAGASSVDQSSITGESVPVDVESGDGVYAGTINGPGALSIRVLKASGDTTLARIIEMVETAQNRRAPSQQFVDRFSAFYTPIVIVGALLIGTLPPLLLGQPFGDWFYRALVLLVVACPCALVISTPVSIVSAIGAATKRGVLVKGGATLEALGKVRAIAFDKTGTLTEGRPKVVAVEAQDGDGDSLLKLAAEVESRSEHPLAKAIVHAARDLHKGHKVEATNFTALPGLGAKATVEGREVYAGSARMFEEHGISTAPTQLSLENQQAQGRTPILVGTERDGVLGIVSLADVPRHDAREAVQALREAGITAVAMLTGDNERTAAAISAQVGVDEYYANLLPGDKLSAIGKMQAKHGAVAMVGDGVNDTPALAAADVGIAMGVAGTDAALEVADIALMSDDLTRLAYAVRLSRHTLNIIKANIGVSLAVKAVALVLAASGMLPLWGAIFADMGVSLLVTLNGMKLLVDKG